MIVVTESGKNETDRGSQDRVTSLNKSCPTENISHSVFFLVQKSFFGMSKISFFLSAMSKIVAAISNN